MTTHVTETAAAPSELAVKHFQDMLAFETDCWDVHEAAPRVHRACGCDCWMAVRCDGAASGSDLSPGLLVSVYPRCAF
jgi:hypothetical protein